MANSGQDRHGESQTHYVCVLIVSFDRPLKLALASKLANQPEQAAVQVGAGHQRDVLRL